MASYNTACNLLKSSIARGVDNIMSLHAKDKGIIHTSGIEFHQRKYIAAKCTKAFGKTQIYKETCKCHKDDCPYLTIFTYRKK
ncbi:MAG TPA: hypothetical protein VFJ51_04890 [Nitrososphaeraceae archaeon]|nr:hypothetical protein [Nitrososphaeraceae archaeon]